MALTGGPELGLLHQFLRALATTMEAVGIDPHVNLLYCEQGSAHEATVPIRWQVDELVLITISLLTAIPSSWARGRCSR